MDVRTDLLIMDYAKELAVLLDQTTDNKNDAFERGRKFGLAQAGSLLLQQATAFGADERKLGLAALSSRKDLGLR